MSGKGKKKGKNKSKGYANNNSSESNQLLTTSTSSDVAAEETQLAMVSDNIHKTPTPTSAGKPTKGYQPLNSDNSALDGGDEADNEDIVVSTSLSASSSVSDDKNSFFEAITLGLQNQGITIPGITDSAKNLRLACRDFLDTDVETANWIQQKNEFKADFSFDDYKDSLACNEEEILEKQKKRGFQVWKLIAGNPEIEGGLVCKMLASHAQLITLHFILEIKSKSKVKNYFVDSDGTTKNSAATENVIHLLTNDATAYKVIQEPLIASQFLSNPATSNASTTNDKNKPAPTRNEWVYKVVKADAYASLGLEALYEIFNFVYLQKALNTIADITGVEPWVKEAAVLPLTAFLTLGDSGANVTTFDPEEEADKFSRALPDGFIVGTANYLKKCFGSLNGFVTVGIPTLSMVINFPIGAYADVESIMDWMKKNMGAGAYVVLAIVEILGPSYYVFFSGQDTLDGVDFFLNRGEQRLNPPQETLWTKFWKDGEYSSAIQAELERTLQNFTRSISFAFLAGRAMQQFLGEKPGEEANDANYWPVLISQLIGFGATYLQCHLSRGPKAYRKYFGSQDNRLDLIKLDEVAKRKKDVYGQMTWATYIANEFRRFFSPIPLAETALVSYFSAQVPGQISALASVEALAGWPLEYAMPATLAILTSSALYLGIYRQASVKLEMRTAILDEKREAEETAKNPAKPAIEIKIESNKNNNEEEPKPRQSYCTRISNAAASLFSVRSLSTFFALSTQTSRTLLSIPQTLGVLQKYTGMSTRDGAVIAATTASTVQFSASSLDYMRDKSVSTITKVKQSCRPATYTELEKEDKDEDDSKEANNLRRRQLESSISLMQRRKA